MATRLSGAMDTIGSGIQNVVSAGTGMIRRNSDQKIEEDDDYFQSNVIMQSSLRDVAQDLHLEERGEMELMEAAQRAGWSKGEMAEAVKKVASQGGQNGHKYSREEFSDASTLPAVVLINNGRFEDLTPVDVQALFDCLDRDNSGELDFEEIKLLLTEVLEPPCSDDQVELVYQLTDKRPDGQVSVDELFRALTDGPVKQHLRQLQKENAALKDLQAFLGVSAKIDRKFMLDRLRWTVNRDDAFKTLPFSMALIAIFICLVVLHLAIFDRQMVEDGLEDWVEGYAGGPVGPYIEAVSDVDGMFDWLSASGVAAVFGNCHLDATHSQASSCIVGSRGTLIGDARLYQTKRDGTEHSVWLLSADPARAILADRPDAYFDAAMATVNHLHSISWADDATMEIHLVFNTFGRDAQMFAVTDVQTLLDDFGFVTPIVSVSAVMIDPYPQPIAKQVFYYIIDSLFLLCLLMPLSSELKDLCHAIYLTGLVDACQSYWDIWNFVDWLNIASGVTGVAFWIMSCQAMHDESIYRLLKTSETGALLLVPGVMGLNEDDLFALDDAFAHIISLFFILRIVVACNSVLIVFKFFKASQANPRLRIVTETLMKATGDIFHWAVVFLAVFLGFAVTGHILFGIDLVQFRSFGASVDSCFRTLMGEFEWYVEMSTSLKPALSSGMPKILVNLWYYVFMLFVLLILVNMLLAIVLEHYIELLGRLKSDPHAPTVWKQAFAFIADRRGHRGFIPQTDLLHVLEDDDLQDDPLQKEVSEENMLQTFPQMKEEQAVWLMHWLEQHALMKTKETHSDVENALGMLEGLVETITDNLHTVKLNVAMCTSKLRHVTKGANAPHTHTNQTNNERRTSRSPPQSSPPMSVCASRENSRVPDQSDADGRRLSKSSNSGENYRRNSNSKPKPAQIPVKEHVDNMTLKLGSAVQDLQWQLSGAIEKLAQQSDKFMTLAQNHAPATSALPEEHNAWNNPSAVSSIAAKTRSRENPKAPASREMTMPPCWSVSGQRIAS